MIKLELIPGAAICKSQVDIVDYNIILLAPFGSYKFEIRVGQYSRNKDS